MIRKLLTGTTISAALLMSGCSITLDDEETREHETFFKQYTPADVGDIQALPDIEVIDGVTYVDGILVVNKEIPLPADYNPGLQQEVIDAYSEMFADGAERGLDFTLVSDFRTYDYQAGLYNNYVARDGQAEADKYSARPGHSEHQTGLAIDVGSTDSATTLSIKFGETPEYEWMKDVAHEYGFIVRYLEGKEDITGYQYEPWHLRYVGDAAEAIYESGLTLEEYLGID
ncbi:M15 family metallopeptidase [Salinicoccus halodurans]|uniref:D-Ala-D-Ala carboxypeptidase n=1 Tax=Salinicoccus halodurans TaxID=407035 RepID=A0A0F7HM51_9STAP|nr:M15 family metallopeptidase [Salinicoccus halodurans]AKG74537.1 D-Ala-D-Ala carboxypeptidase [Salinicoccus halodurans]SFK90078.1 D-Ala-D-Ala carboxypeptidase. Metallo peptidase. MEROPS family M15B [Salinicoccus halodurans]